MKRIVLLVGLLLLGQGVSVMAQESLYSFTMKTIDGKDQPLSEYRGKVLLIVNTASRCGFTQQYKGLEALYQRTKDRGLVVMGFPANDFMGQEPGNNEEIQQFCRLNYGVTFPMFAKISVKGPSTHPLYKYLTEFSDPPGPISWNFNKFLIDRSGRIIARWGSRTAPDAKELAAKVEEALFLPSPAQAGIAYNAHTQVELVSEVQSVQPGGRFHVAVRFKMDPGWHIYWKDPGDSGMAPAIQWDLPSDVTAGSIEWPRPRRIELDSLVNYVYEGEVLLMVPIEAPISLPAGGEMVLRAAVRWLSCEKACVLGQADLSLALPVRREAPLPDARWAKAFSKARKGLPQTKTEGGAQ